MHTLHVFSKCIAAPEERQINLVVLIADTSLFVFLNDGFQKHEEAEVVTCFQKLADVDLACQEKWHDIMCYWPLNS